MIALWLALFDKSKEQVFTMGPLWAFYAHNRLRTYTHYSAMVVWNVLR